MPTIDPNPACPPQGWGEDGITEFLDKAHRNSLANFWNHRDSFARLIDIDKAFSYLVKNLYNDPHVYEQLLLNRTHCTFLAACRTGLAGQFTDTFPHVRALLETACYAHHISKHSGAGEVWRNRNNSEADQRACRREFSWGNVKKTLEDCAPEVSRRIRALYDLTIDLGAHPNQRSVFSVLDIVNEDGDICLDQACLTDDNPLLQASLQLIAKASVGSLYVFGQIFPVRYRLIGFVEKLKVLRSGL